MKFITVKSNREVTAVYETVRTIRIRNSVSISRIKFEFLNNLKEIIWPATNVIKSSIFEILCNTRGEMSPPRKDCF